MIVSAQAQAVALPLGFVSLDSFVDEGTVAFSINNLTGLGFDFPINPVAFLAATLTVTPVGGSPQVIDLGDIPAGALLQPDGFPPAVLQFPDSAQFSSAFFSATLETTSFLLEDGSTFVAPSPRVTGSLLPFAGSTLTPGVDFTLLEPLLEPIPEPSTLVLVSGALAGWAARRRRRRAASHDGSLSVRQFKS